MLTKVLCNELLCFRKSGNNRRRSRSLLQAVENLLQHEVDERRAVSTCGACFDDLVISMLLGMYHIFHGQMREHRVQFAEDERLPQPADAPVAIAEGVNEFKLVMEDTAAYEQVVFRLLKPSQITGA